MNIAVFGASGAIGQHFVRKALDAGHHVKAYVRDINQYQTQHDHLTVVEGELSDFFKIQDFISKADVVVSTLGSSMAKDAKGYPILEGHINIMKAMEIKGLKRFIVLGTPSLKFHKDKKSFMTVVSPMMGKHFVPNGYREIVAFGRVIDSSKLDWTVVRFLMPVNEKTSSAKVTFGEKKINWKISREEIAEFVFKQLTDQTYIQSMPIIGS